MLPYSFEESLKEINPNLYLVFDNEYQEWQICENRSFPENTGNILIDGKLICIHYTIETPVTIQSLGLTGLTQDALLLIKKSEYMNRNIGSVNFVKQISQKNKALRKLKRIKRQNNIFDAVNERKDRLAGVKKFSFIA